MKKNHLGIAIGIFMALLSLFPQFYFQIKRGEEYKGATFYYDYDESAYASYLQSLIDGSPRKNNIYENSNQSQIGESFLTIQFVAAYVVAIPARILGLSSDTAFLVVSVVFSFLASLAVFWLLLLLTENPYLSTVGTLFVLLFGTNVSGASIINELLGFGSTFFYLTFLRRYTPAVSFPFIFFLIGFVWLGLKSVKPLERYFYAILVSLCFAILTFSYFFHWTGMFAWMVCLAGLHFIFQKENRRSGFWIVIFSNIALILLFYFSMLSNRNPTTDTSQILEQTRKAIFSQPSLLLGLFNCVLILLAIKTKRLELQNQLTIFLFSLSVLPILVFNQQIVTGHSLQPIHYGMYLVNYLDLLCLVLILGQFFKENVEKFNYKIWIVVGVILCSWGVLENYFSTKYRFLYNVKRDESFLVNQRLAELGKSDIVQAKSQFVLGVDVVQRDNQRTIAPQGVLWAEHLYLSVDTSTEENQRRFFLYYYFQNQSPKQLRQYLQNCPNEACRALIGWKINPKLSINSSKIEQSEIDFWVDKYSEYINNFSSSEAYKPPVSYLIVRNGLNYDFANFEKWYQKDDGEKLGEFILYQVKPVNK